MNDLYFREHHKGDGADTQVRPYENQHASKSQTLLPQSGLTPLFPLTPKGGIMPAKIET